MSYMSLTPTDQMHHQCKNTKKGDYLQHLDDRHSPLTIKVFLVFSVSVIVGDFLQFPMSHRHDFGHKN